MGTPLKTYSFYGLIYHSPLGDQVVDKLVENSGADLDFETPLVSRKFVQDEVERANKKIREAGFSEFYDIEYNVFYENGQDCTFALYFKESHRSDWSSTLRLDRDKEWMIGVPVLEPQKTAILELAKKIGFKDPETDLGWWAVAEYD